MVRFGAIVRFLMLVVCLVPFTGARQTAGALVPSAPANEAPGGEDDERETDAKERVTGQAKHRPPARELIDTLPPARDTHRALPSHVRATPPVAADPFRNGLGTPYRC